MPEIAARTRLKSHEVTLMIPSKNKTRGGCHNPSHSRGRIPKFPLPLTCLNINRTERSIALITINPDYATK